MKVAVIQSNYIPWRGYFDFINNVDLFVIYDDVQFSKGSWRNRNKLRFQKESKWITVPVDVKLGTMINEVTINSKRDWRKEHEELITQSLSNAPFFKEALSIWKKGVDVDTEYLTVINENLIRTICEFLEIKTKIIRSDEFELSGTKTDRLMSLFKQIDCTAYLSGPAAESYLDMNEFKQNNIKLIYKTYDYKPYPQLQDGFESTVTVLDLIANVGKAGSIELLKSTQPDKCVVG